MGLPKVRSLSPSLIRIATHRLAARVLASLRNSSIMPFLEAGRYHCSIPRIVIASLHCTVLYGDGEMAGLPRWIRWER